MINGHTVDHESKSGGKTERNSPLVLGRRLLDRDLGQTIGLRPGVAQGELGKARVVDPLVEELIIGLTRQIFDDRAQVGGLHGAQGVTFQVGPNAATIEVLTQAGSQHVQDPAALRVGTVIELLAFRVIGPMVNGKLIRLLTENALGVPIEIIEKTIAAKTVPEIEVLVEGSEALVEPKVGPVLARDIVPKPLVGQFMGHQGETAAQPAAVGGEERSMGEDGGRRILHAAGHEVLHHDLIIFYPGIGHPDLSLEIVHHVGGAGKGIGRHGRIALRHIESQGNIAMPQRDLLEVPRGQGDQVADMGFFLMPMGDLQAVGHLFGHQTSI